MPIGPFEREILRLLARHRNPESYVVGATVLHAADDSPRISGDIDIFHDTAQSVASSARADLDALAAAGYATDLLIAFPTFQRATVRRGTDATKLEWVFDSAFRFFPIETDPLLGFRLGLWDAATNKVLALASRREVRDLIDVVYLHETQLSFGALAWAAAGKDAGLTPTFILDQARRTTHYTQADLDRLVSSEPTRMVDIQPRWMRALDEAAALVAALPPDEVGCLYLDENGRPVTPQPIDAAFVALRRHRGSVGGAWPVVAE